LREARSLIDLSLVKRIEVLGYWKDGLPIEDRISENIKFIRIKTLLKKQVGAFKFLNLLSFPIFYLAIILKCFREKPGVVNCHALTVLPLGFLLKIFFGVKLVYDPHELETETNDSRGFRKKAAKLIEKLLIHQADFIIVVGHNIEKWYRNNYSVEKIATIRNIPSSAALSIGSSSLRTLLNIREDEIVFIYVGILEKGRAVPLLIETFKNTDPNKHLVFIGYGNLYSYVEQATKEKSNIHLLPAVSSNEVISYIAQANVGLCIIENTCLSYFYCLPNKSFEYIRAGVPFISSRFPELVGEFESSEICWFVDPGTTDIFGVVTCISEEDIKQKKEKIRDASNRWVWKEESLKYKEVYNNL
jgi:glycosyltransferase involved in cell wall biosynthesis